MKNLLTLFRMIVVAGCLLFTGSLAYAVPGTINYQGVLTDSGGIPFNQDVSVTFRLFDVATGGTSAWTETQTVTVANGVYNVQLGQVSPLTGVDFTASYWLEVEVGGETLTPRQALTSVPYAMSAASVEQIDPAALPANGLATVSNNLLTNQFIETASGSSSTPIPDHDPGGVEDSLVFPDVGNAETISVSLRIENSDLSTITVTLMAPNNDVYVLLDGSTGGTGFSSSFPTPTATISGDLTTWIGQNPTGTWTLKVVDSGYLNNTTDGEITAWSISIQHVSTETVSVAADLDITGTVSGDGSGLTALDWGNLANLPAGFSDNVDDVVSSVDNLSGGQITSNVAIGTLPASEIQLTVTGSGSEFTAGYFDANYSGADPSYGLYARSGVSGSGNHYGVYGFSGNSSAYNYGVYGNSSGGTHATGVYGSAAMTSEDSRGVEGQATGSSPVNYGVYGVADRGSEANYGIYGLANGTNAYAGYFDGNAKVTSDLSVDGELGFGTDPVTGRKLNVSGGTSDSYAGYFENNNNTLNNAYGIYVNTQGAIDQTRGFSHYGVHAKGSGARFNYGFRGYAYDAGAYQNFGIKGSATSAAFSNYGVYGEADNGTNYNYAIYGEAGNSTANYAGYFYGNVHVTGSLTEDSDLRLKENILPVENALDKVEAINGVYFNFKDSPDKTMVGVIAQDVQAVLPEAVSVTDPETGYLGVSYTSLVPVLIEAVKELKAENEALQVRIEALEGGTK